MPEEKDLYSVEQDEGLYHYGKGHTQGGHSGRYPWGSGSHSYQRSGSFLDRVEQMKREGCSEADIYKYFGFPSSSEYRLQVRLAKHEVWAANLNRAQALKDKGYNTTEIGRELGVPESTVRSWFNKETQENKNRVYTTADILKQEVASKGMIEVGGMANATLGVSADTMKESIYYLEQQGYRRYVISIPQITNPGKQINTVVLAPPDDRIKAGMSKKEMEALYRQGWSEAYAKVHDGTLREVGEFHSEDGGSSFSSLKYPASLDSKRIAVRYGDKGGSDMDGVIEIRRGVPDLDLGDSHYAQVRILVDGTHYLKGMAMYSDNVPKGADILFNTNKPSSKSKMEVMKKIKSPEEGGDPNNPFGAYIPAMGQSTYIGKDGKSHLSPINKLRWEGDWDEQARNLSSQFVSKQPMDFIKKQLNATYADYNARFDEIKSLTNPTLKKKMLSDFADNCDGAAEHMKAAALPRQRTQVLLPVPGMKDNEVYAQNFRNGEQVALIRYPHGGTFEIPILRVNNKNPDAIKALGKAKDAVGINKKVADRLSGADFDGDTVVVIPLSSKVRVTSTPQLNGLKNFDPKTSYGYDKKTVDKNGTEHYFYKGHEYKIMSEKEKQKQMGVVSNLITDMTLQGADPDKIARAVRHSMTVIDAPKHKLDYKRSERENGIAELKHEYQAKIDPVTGKETYGAKTLISRRKQEVRVPERRGSAMIDKDTGEVSYKTSGRTYINKEGKTVQATTKVKLISETKDVRTLSTGTQQEEAYANYANKMKALANDARKEMVSTKGSVYNANSAKVYSKEVSSLNSKLNLAEAQSPREHRAQVLANGRVNALISENPSIKDDKARLKKIKQTYINDARASVGMDSSVKNFKVTDREWEAIQSGALSNSKVSRILKYTDQDDLVQRALPKNTTTISPAKQAKMKAMSEQGYTAAEIADAIGVSTSTVYSKLSN